MSSLVFIVSKEKDESKKLLFLFDLFANGSDTIKKYACSL